MGNVFYFNWEISLMEWLQSFESGFITSIAKLFTMLGEEYFLILILGLFYWSLDKNLGKRISLGLLGSTMFGTLIKGIVLRRRPYMDNDGIKCIRAAHPEEDIMSISNQGYSLPSLHATMSAGTYGTVAINKKKIGYTIIAILLPLFIGLSRPYLGVHYPTDVLIGWVIGIIAMILFNYIYNKYGYKIGLIIILVVGLVGFLYCHDIEFYSFYGITIGSLLGFIYEEKRVNFNNTNKIWKIILRPILGVLIFIIINTLLKLPVKNIDSDSYQQFLLIYRLVRYIIVTFIIIGVYPHTFRKI